MDDARVMHRVLRLAERGRGWASPNPLVGAVIVQRGRIVGEGYHRKVGQAHAEAEALVQAGERARGATLYVNLEPCCHQGRTPPCTDALIRAGIKRVVAGLEDPNPAVAGKGFRILRAAAVDVQVGLLAEEARRLNEWYLKYTVTGLPFVILKVAMTLDGKIATRTGESRWITGERARAFSHRLRSHVDALLTGVGTVSLDDPQLTARRGDKLYRRQPWRIVVDSRLHVKPDARVLHGGKTILATTSQASQRRVEELRSVGVQVWVLGTEKGARVELQELLKEAARHGITSVLGEAGASLNASVLKAGLADKVLFFLAPKIMGDGENISAVGDLGVRRLAQVVGVEEMKMRKLGKDLLVEAYVSHKGPGQGRGQG